MYVILGFLAWCVLLGIGAAVGFGIVKGTFNLMRLVGRLFRKAVGKK